MARTSKKTKAVPVATVVEAADVDVRSVGEAETVAAVETGAETASVAASGETVFIPLNKLKKHPKNARKTPHSEASIEGKAASIAAKGILQNLVVEPERDAEGQPTGFYLVAVGEGRRLAQLLRVKRKEIKKTEPIRCLIDTVNDAAEISLDENVTRENLHPADEYERFRELAEDRGWGAEEIAARFGVTAHVVKQRLRLGAVSPKLMQVYRDGGLTLDQLMAFAITEDHARQEQVFANLSYNRDPAQIRRDLTKANVPATDRRAIFIGAEAYIEAGGNIIRDLFTEDRGGFYEDAALLDRLVMEKLESIAFRVRGDEGWKWWEAHIDFPHAHGMRRVYPHPVELSAEDAADYAAAQEEYDRLSSEYEDAEEDGKPLSDILVRDLTAHRTLGLRLALGEQPDMALTAVTHALAAQTFYRGVDAHCLEIRPISASLGGHADGIEDTAAAKALADRHAGWAADMPRDVADLWGFIAGLDHASVMALFAHCASQTVNAVKLPWERKPRVLETADKLASALTLDMTAHWTPTVRTYLGRVTKALILDAVREAVSDEAADRLAAMKKQPMAEAAEQLLAGTGWLPPLMRNTPVAETERGPVEDIAAPEGGEGFPEAAE